jgi:hypothetical protein
MNNSATGVIYSVNDISGIPSIEVLDTGTIRFAQYGGNVGFGTANPAAKTHVSSGDGSLTLYGPNTTWGGKLFVGAAPNQSATTTAQVIVTDGNLHLDAATNTKSIYLNFYATTSDIRLGTHVYQKLGQYIFPGSNSGLTDWQSSYYIASNSTWGLYTNTSMNIQGCYDVGNRVWSASNVNTFYVGTTAITGNRASAAQSLSGISSIDGSSVRIVAGSSTIDSAPGQGLEVFYNWGGTGGGTNAPATGYYVTGISIGSHPNDQAYGWQLAQNMWADDLWVRRRDASTYRTWYKLLSTANYSTYSTFTTPVTEPKVAMAANAVDLSAGSMFSKTIAGATTLTVSGVQTSGRTSSFILDLTNGGSATITWWAGMKWAGGTAPTLTASGRDVLGFFTHDGGATWTGLILGKDVK